jgi:hypothetical protein
MHTIQLQWRLEHGSEGLDTDANNPLSRAVNRLFQEDGQPFRRISLCWFGEKWLGVFVISDHQQLVFFPGFDFTPEWIQILRVGRLETQRPFEVDHISLEKNRSRWHFTKPKSTGHQPGGKTSNLGEGRVLWFGLSIAAPTVLRDLRRETIISFQSPASDSNRRARVFMEAEKNNQSLIVRLASDAQHNFPQGFIHFAFIVGPRGFPDYEGTEMNSPHGSPFVTAASRDLVTVPIWSGRFSLQESDIQIRSARLPGTLTVPAVLTSA